MDLDCGGNNPMLVTLMDIVLFSAVLSECHSCLCFFSSVAFLENCHPKIISHSVVNRQNKKPINRDSKNRWERCSRFKMMFYVTALKFKDGTVCSSDYSLTVPKSLECRRRYFLLAYTQALGSFASAFFSIKTSCIQL